MDRRCFGRTVLLAAAYPLMPSGVAVDYGGRITRAAVMARAHDWLSRKVRYSQDNRLARWDLNKGRRYRPDCSGFICMAWAIDSRDPRYGRALTTWELRQVVTPISRAGLQPGDVLLRARAGHRGSDHVRLFEAWADPARTVATVIESSSKAGGMQRRTVVLAQAARYKPYRYLRIV
ncbi:hypothetical protein ACIA8K_33785 [Catenuloplanes sp. NPDC051500]|uniref:hypothetical protein n=1 Tax=Catenuloplanes sp. NPDC051500 TaxID=3363959 RepID=UPI00379382F8